MTHHNEIAILGALIALFCGTTPYGGLSCAGQEIAESGAPKPHDEVIDPIHVLSVEHARRSESKIKHLYSKQAPAVVRLWPQQQPSEAPGNQDGTEHGSLSGVIIDPSGLILTCAHHGETPGTNAAIQLSDGRRVNGEFLGRFAYDSPKPMEVGIDLGLARISDSGPWPTASLHVKGTQFEAQMCLAIGYPGTLPSGRPPLLRAGRILPRFRGSPWLETTMNLETGDSGGPLFDLQGDVVGIASGADNVGPATYESLLALKEYRQRLEAGEIVRASQGYVRASRSRPAQPGVFVPAPDLDDQILKTSRNVFRIMDGPHEVAAGLIVSADGLALTKASLVGSRREWSCRLFYVTGTTAIVKGRVVATSPTHDVALMKIDVHEWPVAPWSQHRPSVGTIVCSPLGRSGEPMRFAVVGSEQAVELAKPNDIPQIPVSIQPGAAGAPVVSSSDWTTAEFDGYRELLKVGDVITRINDIETSTAKEFGEAVDRLTYVCATNDSVDYQAAAPGSFAGDWVHLYIRRDSEHLTVPIPKIHSVSQGALTWHANPLSLRREAFPSVFAHDGNLRPEQCGGPVVDLQGNVVGLNVARADATRTLAIPSDVLQEILAELRRQAAEVQVDAKTPKVVSAGENIEIAGIGVALDVQDGRCLVRAVLPDSAAAKLGAPRVGDQILSVAEANAEPVTVKGMSLTEVVKLVRGEKGTTVRMTIISKGETENEARVVSLVRGSVKVLETVGDGKLLKPDTEIPDFEYIRLDKVGKGRIRDHIGKTVVLDFWASWCAPCIQSLDKWHAFLEVHPELRGKVEFIAIGVDEQMEDAVRTFEKRQWTSMTVVWAGPDVMKSYHLNSMPTVYFVGPGGRVRSTDQRLDLKSILTSEHKASQ